MSTQALPNPLIGAVTAALPEGENDRIKKLLSYKVLDTDAETAYNDLIAIAAQICDTPISLVSMVDRDRQWFKAKVGIEANETPRDLAFCAHAILRPEVMVVPDARLDPRFSTNPLVVGEPFIRFYAGAPLITPDGYALGTLCVVDSEPKTLTSIQVEALEALARLVVGQLEMRLTLQQLTKEVDEKEAAQSALEQANASLEARVEERTQVIQQKSEALKEALEELQHTQSHLVHSEKIASLGQLVAGVAHEINNPLGFISGSVGHTQSYTADLIELLKLYQDTYGEENESIAELSEEIGPDFIIDDLTKMLESMDMGAERIIEIVRSLSSFSRQEQPGLHPANLHMGIDNTLMLLGHRLRMASSNRPPIEVVKHYSDIPEINCDIGQLNQVFMNLLANSVDAFEVDQQQRVEHPTITIATALVDNQVVISITDNGAGMPESVVQSMFRPFFTTKETGKGTGLGLSISRKVIERKHKGEIICESQLGKGTTFILKIPSDLPMESPEAALENL